MWLFTNRGFYSVVADSTTPDTLLVRARLRGDLERLGTLLPEKPVVTESRDRDYRWRMKVPFALWPAVMGQLATEITYPNFKNEVKKRQGRGRADLYGAVWAEMFTAQENEAATEYEAALAARKLRAQRDMEDA